MAVVPEQMPFPTELLQKIINHYLDILNDLVSQVDRHIIHEDWLAIRHTSPQFCDLLGAPSLEARNPYKTFTAEFEGQTYDGLAVDFQKAIDLFGTWADHLNVLQSATPFPITLTMKFIRCLAVPTEDICYVFAGLQKPHIARTISSFNLTIASDFTHIVDLPSFPILEHLHLHLNDMKSSLHCTLGHCCFPTTEPDNQMVIRASQLQMLSIVSSNPSIVRVEDARQLRALGINFMIVGCRWGCGRHDNSAHCTLTHALLRPRAIFNDFDAVAITLTRLDLSVKLSWLEGVNTLCLPNVTVLKMRTTSTYHSPQSSPVTKLDAPRLEKASLQLCDTRIIDFTGSTFAGSVKQLMVSTPCYVMKKMEHDTRIWTQVNFIVYYPRVEEIVLAIHGITIAKSCPVVQHKKAIASDGRWYRRLAPGR